jgi:hypothetical protein
VEVRRHQAERMNRPTVSLGAVADPGEEHAAVVVASEDCATVHAA